jgi:CheY-like chemotaxis protein
LNGRLGHPVQAVNDGPTALESARAFRPEVVLLDIGLPGMDGYEVASRLRSQAGARSLVLVAITGYGQEEDRRRSHEAGFDFHLVKPIDLEILKRILNRITPARSPS